MEDMYDIICSYADSEADVIYFKIKSVLSENIRIESNRCSYINKIIDQYLADGDEWPVRATIYTVHCKMFKRSLIVHEIAKCFNIEDDEISDTLLNRSDKLSHFVEIYQLKQAS